MFEHVKKDNTMNPRGQFSANTLYETALNPKSTYVPDKKYGAISLYSGGVDSTLASILAAKELKVEILLLMANLSIGKQDLRTAIDRAKVLGMDLAIIDGHGYFADNYLSEAIVMNANYQGYPLGTPMGRAFVVMAAVDVLKRADATFRYVVHGCVRRQNTRVRIEQLASTHEILGYGPLSIGSPLDRQTKIRLLKGYGIEAVSQDSFATDENIWNRAVEGLNLNDLKVKIDDKAIFSWTKPIEDTPNNADYLTLVFSRGTLISINGIKTCLHKMIEKVLFLGAEHGVGRVMVIEDTIPLFSEKIRDYYEAPSAMIITAAHKLIESCVLTKQERDEKERLDKEWGEQVYAGNWFYPSVRNMAQRGWEMQKKVSGSVTLKLFKGNICIETADIPESRLLVAREGIATY